MISNLSTKVFAGLVDALVWLRPGWGRSARWHSALLLRDGAFEEAEPSEDGSL